MSVNHIAGFFDQQCLPNQLLDHFDFCSPRNTQYRKCCRFSFWMGMFRHYYQSLRWYYCLIRNIFWIRHRIVLIVLIPRLFCINLGNREKERHILLLMVVHHSIISISWFTGWIVLIFMGTGNIQRWNGVRFLIRVVRYGHQPIKLQDSLISDISWINPFQATGPEL